MIMVMMMTMMPIKEMFIIHFALKCMTCIHSSHFFDDEEKIKLYALQSTLDKITLA